MFRVNQWLFGLTVGVAVFGCTTPPPSKEEAPPASTPTTNPSTAKTKLIGDATPGQALIAVREWLAVYRGTNPKPLAALTGYPFSSRGLMPTEGPDAEACRNKERAETKEAFAETAACLMKNPLFRENIPTNLLVNSVFEIKVVTLDKAFADQRELTEIWSHKKELEAECCRAYIQTFFPGDKNNAYLLFAVDWINGNVRVVSVLAELDPIE